MTYDEAQHAGELLSALVDGELSDDEADRVLAHVDVCAACAHELDLLERARSALRSLPELEPPSDFIEQIVRRRHRMLVRGTVGGLVAAVLMVVVAVTTTVGPAVDVEPELAAFEADHATTSATIVPADTVSQVSEFGDVTVENEIAGLDLVAVDDTGAAVHAMYRGDDDVVVSLFQQPGEPDWDALPGEGQRFKVGEREAYQDPAGTALVVDTGGVVVTLVGGDADVRTAMASEVPDAPGTSWFDRLHRASQQIVRAFGLD